MSDTQPFDRHRQSVHRTKTALDAFDHQVADIAAVDAGARGDPGEDRLAVAAVERERNAHPLGVIAADLEPIRASARVRPIDGDAAVMPPLHAIAGMTLRQRTVRFHDPRASS